LARLLQILALYLSDTKNSLKDTGSSQEKPDDSRVLASETVATFAVQKGLQGADNIDIFRAELDNYAVLIGTKCAKGIDKNEIAKRLSFLSDLASEYAKKEFNSQEKERHLSNETTKYPPHIK
jgi:hypothetical protein